MTLGIGEFSRLARVSVKALRLYDRLELLKPARIDAIIGNRDAWKWTSMISQPEWVTEERVERAMASVEKKKNLPALQRVRFESFHEGRAAQIMHVGPFSEEGPTVEKVDRFIEERGAKTRVKHHEIYLTDPRRTAPEKNRTIVRHPF